MTDVELSALEAAAKAATPGPWDCGGVEVFLGEWNPLIAMCNSEDNAAYIAAANPAAILSLIAEIRQARAERDWLAENMPNSYSECHCPEGHYKPDCEPEPTAGGKVCYECLLCWLQAAKEAVCQK